MSIWVNGKKKFAQYAHIQRGKCMAWVGLGPRIDSRGQSACLLARTEVRVWMGKADPTSAPRGSQCPRSGDDAACFTALDPSQKRVCPGHYSTNCCIIIGRVSHRRLSCSGLI